MPADSHSAVPPFPREHPCYPWSLTANHFRAKGMSYEECLLNSEKKLNFVYVISVSLRVSKILSLRVSILCNFSFFQVNSLLNVDTMYFHLCTFIF